MSLWFAFAMLFAVVVWALVELVLTLRARHRTFIATSSTAGFPKRGYLIIGDRVVRYTAKTATGFYVRTKDHSA